MGTRHSSAFKNWSLITGCILVLYSEYLSSFNMSAFCRRPCCCCYRISVSSLVVSHIAVPSTISDLLWWDKENADTLLKSSFLFNDNHSNHVTFTGSREHRWNTTVLFKRSSTNLIVTSKFLKQFWSLDWNHLISVVVSDWPWVQ